MQYVLLICGRASYAYANNTEADGQATEEWLTEMRDRGIRQLGRPLHPATSATTVRLRDGELLLTDGPFAETTEQILGFDLIECTDLDEAIEVASKHPAASIGSIEVRPVWPT